MKKVIKKLALVLSTILIINTVFAGTSIATKAEDGVASVTFSFGDTSLTYGEVQWKNGDEGWHTQTEGATVSATQVRIVYKNEGQLDTYTALYIDGGDVLGANKEALQSEAGMNLVSGGEYAFQNIKFVANPGGQGSPDPNPQNPGSGPNAGDVQININNNQNGKVSYQIGDGSWTQIEGNTYTLRASNELSSVTSGTSIKFKAEPNENQSLDTHDKQNKINDGSGDTQIDLTALAAGTYSISYDNTKSYSMQIAFENGGNGGQGGGTPGAGPNAGDVQININNNQNGKVSYQIGDGSWTQIEGNTYTLRASNELGSVTSGTSIKFKAEPNENQSLDTHDKQNKINDGSGDTQIDLTALAAGTYSIYYDNTKSYSIQIAFDNGGNGGQGGGNPGSGPNPGDIQINITNLQKGSFQYKIGDGQWKSIDDGGFTLQSDRELYNVDDGTPIYFKATPDNGCAIDTNSKVRYDNTDYPIDISELAVGTYNVAYDRGKTYSLSTGFTGDIENPITIALNITGKEANFFTNDSWVKIDGKDARSGSATVSQATNHTLSFQVDFGAAISKIKVKDTEYTPTEGEDSYYSVVVPESDLVVVEGANVYNVVLTKGEGNNVTIVWAYDEQTSIEKYGNNDAWVENGTVEIEKIVRGESVLFDRANSVGNPSDFGIRSDGGDVFLKRGDDITLRLIPNYGYQLSSVNINGTDSLQPETNVSTFTISNLQGNIHFRGVFVKANDVLVDNSTVISDPSIGDPQNAASSGNLKLTVADNNTYSTDVTSVVDGENVAKVASLDFTLENIVSKGTANSYWTSGISSFTNDINLAMSIDFTQLGEGEEFSVVRDHNGTLTELPVNCNPDDGVIDFPTNQFSTYTIVKKKVAQPLPDSLFTEGEDGLFYLTITDNNKDVIAAYKSFIVSSNHVIIVDTNFTISGHIDFDFDSGLIINKGRSISATEGVNFPGVTRVGLGDKNALTGLGIDASKVKTKKTGDPTYYDFDINTIDNTEFSYENGMLVYKDGPDCGFLLNSNFSFYDEENNTKYGEITYKVYNPSGSLVKTGTLYKDFESIDIAPEVFTTGSKIEFVVKAFAVGGNTKILQSNGVRFPNNKNYISTAEEEAKVGTSDGCTCSYILTETPSEYIGLYVELIDSSDLQTTADFEWSYDSKVLASDGGFDKYVSHGTIEVISAKAGGASVTNTNDKDVAPYWTTQGNPIHVDEGNGQEWDEMRGKFAPGTEVTVRLIPDRGYQLTQFTISNIPGSTTPVDGVNEYTFVLSRADFFHLAAVFSPVSDEVDSSSASGVTGGSVAFAEGEVSNGTMALNVSDVTPSTTEMDKFNEMADGNGYSVDKCLNLESEQRFYKAVENASRSQCWVINKSELSSPASISLAVSGFDGKDVVVLHNHNGVYEEIPATYENGTLTFSAQSFSDFAIASKDKTTESGGGGSESGGSGSGGSGSGSSGSGSGTNSNTSSGTNTVVNAVSSQSEETSVSKTIPLGKITDGEVIKNWNDLKNVLNSKPALTTKRGKVKAASGPLVELQLYNTNTYVPAEVFKSLSLSNYKGIHLFLGQGTALTFMNNKRVANQDSVNVACTTTINTKLRIKVIDFKFYKKLKSSVLLHAVVPEGTKKVTVYFTGSDGVRRRIGTFVPTAQGRLCFSITELGKYELEY